jgi:hypothetical protein
MTAEVRDTLKAVLAVMQREHAPIRRGLAVDEHDRPVAPGDPTAVAWTVAGALIKVAPSHELPPALTHTQAAAEAYDLLERVAVEQGYPSPAAVDVAGREAVLRMLWRAINLIEPDPKHRRRGPAAGTGSSPRGAAA